MLFILLISELSKELKSISVILSQSLNIFSQFCKGEENFNMIVFTLLSTSILPLSRFSL